MVLDVFRVPIVPVDDDHSVTLVIHEQVEELSEYIDDNSTTINVGL